MQSLLTKVFIVINSLCPREDMASNVIPDCRAQ